MKNKTGCINDTESLAYELGVMLCQAYFQTIGHKNQVVGYDIIGNFEAIWQSCKENIPKENLEDGFITEFKNNEVIKSSKGAFAKAYATFIDEDILW